MSKRRFERVFDEHFDEVYSYIAFRIAPDIEGAGDVTQEVFAAALEALSTLRRANNAGAWLRGIARHKIADYFRARQEAPLAADAMNEIQTRRDGSLSPAQEAAIQVSLVLRRLRRGEAEMLEEKYLDGRSVKEIAEIRGMTEKAVESALSRAREAFRKEMSEGRMKEGDCHGLEPE